jgi:hypothetical protein
MSRTFPTQGAPRAAPILHAFLRNFGAKALDSSRVDCGIQHLAILTAASQEFVACRWRACRT